MVRVSSSSDSEEDAASTCSSDYQTADEGDGAISLPVTDNLVSSFSALPLSRPSLEECINYSGIQIDCIVLDRQITDAALISDIAKKLTQWRDLLPYFGLEEYEKEEIIAAGNLSEQKRKLLMMWSQKYGSRATYRHLCTILWEQHRVDLVEAVCDVIKSAATSAEAGPSHPPPQLQSTLSRFRDQLRDWYAKYPLQHYSSTKCRKWMPNICKDYIHPDIISKKEQEEQPDSHKEEVLRGQQWRITKKGSGDTVQLRDLLVAGLEKKKKCVLVEGGPGMGKSTLAWQVCHRWARRELYNQYSTVLLLPLRDKRVQQAKQVEDLFFHLRDKKGQEEVKRDIDNGRDTLVILDGLDELPGHLLSEQSIFTDILSGAVLGDATILVTSRPSATKQLLACWEQRMSRHFVICGFNEDDIYEYAKSILPGKKLMKFKKHLSIHPYIQAIMYVPLHSAIIMAVYVRHKQLPTTRTQLYTWLVKTILSQFITDQSEYSGEDEDVLGLKLPKTVHTYFVQLSNFAFKNVCDQQLIFADIPKELHDLGFTDSVPELFLPESCSYNFLHLSIQEFLAAYHVSLQSLQDQEQLLLRSREVYHFKNMTRFVAGLTKFKEISKEAVKQVVVVKERMSLEKSCLDSYSLELLYECQNMSVLDKEDTYYPIFRWSSQAHLYLALGYCIANSKCAWTLDLSSSGKPVLAQMLLQGLQDCKTQPAYTIKRVYWTSYCDKVHGKLLDFIIHTESMELRVRQDQSLEHLIHFCLWLRTCQLKTLELPFLKPHNIEMVSRALTAVPSLKTLNMEWSKFTLQSMQAFVSMLQQNQSLTKVRISNCSIDSDSACCLARALYSNTTLTVLDMGWNSVGERGALAMAEMLKHNTTLTVLHMSGNSVGERGALAVAEMLKHNTTLTELEMSWNSVGERGALAMAEMFKHNTTLTVLHMSGNSVGERGALAMAEMLKHNITLTNLNMCDSVGENGALAMAEMLKHNTTLTELGMFGNSVGERGALAMAEMLEHNTTLTKLNMCGNSVGERGTLAMAEMLKHNTTLTGLYMDKNSVGERGALAMAEMLKHNTTLTDLSTIDAAIGVEGAKALVKSLAVNHHLNRLCISNEYMKEVTALPAYHDHKECIFFSFCK